MARIFMDGWEYGKPSTAIVSQASTDFNDSIWDYRIANDGSNVIYGSIIASSTAYNGGDYSLKWQRTFGGGVGLREICAFKQLSTTYNKLYARMNFRFVSKTSQTYTILSFDDTTFVGASLSMQIKFNTSTGDMNLYVNGSSVASKTGAFLTTVWHLFEVLYDSAGSNIVIKIDNTEIINYSGTIDSAIQYVILGNSDQINKFGLFEFYIDDFALNDNSGSVNNSWIGAGVIRLIKPTSDDTNTDFTPSTGSDHYALVDDFPDDGDTTYNSSTVSGDIDTFGLESVPSVATGQTINAVQAVYRARSETDVASVAPILISGATTDTGATQSTVLSDYNDTKQKVYDVDPNTSAQWTEANVNAVKGGYKNAT